MEKDIFDRLAEISEHNTFLDEFDSVANDPIEFIEKYGTMIHPNKGLIKAALYDHQKKLIRSYHENRLNIVMGARQVGLTETIIQYALYYAFFNSNSRVIIASEKVRHTMSMLQRIFDVYQNLPQIYKDDNRMTMHIKHQVSFSNESEIMIVAANSNGTRGYTADLIIVDNFSYISNEREAVDFYMSAIPSLQGTGKMIITSCSGGSNSLFRQIWVNACLGDNTFIPHRIAWNALPERDTAFKEHTINLIGKPRWDIEYEIPHMIKEDHNGTRKERQFKET